MRAGPLQYIQMSRITKILVSILILAVLAAGLLFWFVIRPQGTLISDVYPLPSDLIWGVPSQATVFDGIKGAWVTSEPVPNTHLSFASYYDKKLKSEGWVPDPTVAADGIDGSLWGYKKDNAFVLLSYKIVPINKQDPNAVGYACPCRTTYKIFTGKR
jgi:hypothetical protein